MIKQLHCCLNFVVLPFLSVVQHCWDCLDHCDREPPQNILLIVLPVSVSSLSDLIARQAFGEICSSIVLKMTSRCHDRGYKSATSQDETDDGVATDEKHPLLVFREKIRKEEVQFYCGGSIPVTDGPDHPKGLMADEGSRSSPPVVLRFDDPNGGAIRKLCLPLSGGDQDASAIGGPLRSSAPATFGQGGKAVLDESYREAMTLSRDQFSTDFDPYALGVIDAIAQILLPSFVWPSSVELGMSEERLGVVAELYNLNVSGRAFILLCPRDRHR